MRISTTTLARTAVLGALVVVFDYTLKFSGFKIPFPWLPSLKFDFTGIPVVLSLLLIGLESSVITSSVAFLAILVRSGNIVGSSMKALAELSTVFGMFLGLESLRKMPHLKKPFSFILGCTVRVLIMVPANLLVLPVYYGTPFPTVVLMSPLLAAFNLFHGLLSMFGGYLIYEALIRRVPSIASKEKIETHN